MIFIVYFHDTDISTYITLVLCMQIVSGLPDDFSDKR